ncbi:hypothetical protein [Bradyrhizobium lablabi]|uniref:hypothetical protein n=1 Tax=Bradyrhizobium lablabi TaxID=722472 RepID=UPI001BA64633|nr:hypothetical protein [Bradyrhizobium lablabi]MBR0693656.1 hypothetical protein [Bradyrhizobium lablabi]
MDKESERLRLARKRLTEVEYQYWLAKREYRDAEREANAEFHKLVHQQRQD